MPQPPPPPPHKKENDDRNLEDLIAALGLLQGPLDITSFVAGMVFARLFKGERSLPIALSLANQQQQQAAGGTTTTTTSLQQMLPLLLALGDPDIDRREFYVRLAESAVSTRVTCAEAYLNHVKSLKAILADLRAKNSGSQSTGSLGDEG